MIFIIWLKLLAVKQGNLWSQLHIVSQGNSSEPSMFSRRESLWLAMSGTNAHMLWLRAFYSQTASFQCCICSEWLQFCKHREHGSPSLHLMLLLFDFKVTWANRYLVWQWCRIQWSFLTILACSRGCNAFFLPLQAKHSLTGTHSYLQIKAFIHLKEIK